jgi:glycyl-tRNA synthetase
MAEPRENERMEKIVSLCKRRGFIFQSSEIYGGINGFWDYGPLGAELKRNVKDAWWTTMIRLRDDVVGLDATIIMHPQIWKASGHVDTFADMMVEDPITGRRFRSDQVEAQSGRVFSYRGATDGLKEKLRDLFKKFESAVHDTSLSHPERMHQLQVIQGQILGLSNEAERSDQAAAATARRQIMDRIVGRLLDSDNPDEVQVGIELDALSQASLQPAASCDESFSVLIGDKDNPEKARKLARRFYSEKRGVPSPELAGEMVAGDLVFNSTEYSPETGARLSSPRPFNLMFKTHYGPVESDDNIAYLRPETAQAIFVQFKNVHETSRQRIPFGIAQVGKAFRNEVTPRNFTFRSREFEQMELEFFIRPDEAVEAITCAVAAVPDTGHPGEPQPNWGWLAWHRYWVEERVRFYEGIGLARDTLGFHVQTPEELAHYARATVDILYKFPFSKKDEAGQVAGDELEGIAARSDFDLSQHERFSGKPMGVFDEELRTAWAKLTPEKQQELHGRYYQARLKYLTKSGVPEEKAAAEAKEDADGLAKGQYIPHVIEPSAGADRLILALICNAYDEVTETDAKGNSETRVILRFHPRVAPIKVAVLPLLRNKPALVAKARKVFQSLRGQMNAFYDDGGSIGRRYARQDEVGTPFCVTIDFDTLGEQPELLDTVTLRHRDDGRQERLPIAELPAWLLARVR